MKSIAKYILIVASLTALALAEPNMTTLANGHSYLIEPEQAFNWFEAQHKCQQMGMQLVEIYSAEQQQQMEEVLRPLFPDSINLWLGGNDEFSSSKEYTRPFYWSESGRLFEYALWTSNNPDNARTAEHCVHIWEAEKTFAWNDIECTDKMGYICETNRVNEGNCNELKSKAPVVADYMHNIINGFQSSQSNFKEYLTNTFRMYDDMATSFANYLIYEQNSVFDQLKELMSTNAQMLNSTVEGRINMPSMRSEIISSQVDANIDSFGLQLNSTAELINTILKC